MLYIEHFSFDKISEPDPSVCRKRRNTVYGWAPDVRKIQAAEKDKVLVMEPFLNFT
jgi:hypothetical protein